MTDLRKAAASLLSAVDLALPYAPYRHEFDHVSDTADDLRAALAAEQAPDAEALRAEVEALRRDAERYRWLRDDDDAHASYSAVYFNTGTAAEFDAKIDAAIDAARAQKGE